MDSFETSVIILCVIVIMATAAMFFRRMVAETVMFLGILTIILLVVAFYDRQDQGQLNDEKLATERDKWQNSEVVDR
jgi:HD-like signal output (HDOD) protein